MDKFINNHVRAIRLDIEKETESKDYAIQKANNKNINYLKLMILGIQETKQKNEEITFDPKDIENAIYEIKKAPQSIVKNTLEYIKKIKPELHKKLILSLKKVK